jgi:hypothetical protein
MVEVNFLVLTLPLRSHEDPQRGKLFFIKNISRNIYSTSFGLKAFVLFMHRTVPYENTLSRSEGQFPGIVGSQIRPTCTPKYLQIRILRSLI